MEKRGLSANYLFLLTQYFPFYIIVNDGTYVNF